MDLWTFGELSAEITDWTICTEADKTHVVCNLFLIQFFHKTKYPNKTPELFQKNKFYSKFFFS